MSRIVKLLRPLVAALLALALAVAGSFIGARLLAQPEDRIVAETTEATVLPAVPVDVLPDLGSDDEVEEFLATLPTTSAVVEVPVGYDTAGAAEEFETLLTDVETASDPVSAATLAFPTSGLVPPADPCVADPADCPAGILSTVSGLRTDVTVPALQLVRFGLPAISPDGWAPSCRRPGAVVYAIETNQPVRGELVFWPRSNPTQITRITIESSADQTDGWMARFLAGNDGDPIPTVLNCLTLTFPATGIHEARFTVYSDHGSETRTTQFDSSGRNSLPQAYIFTPSEDLITAIVPHRPDERVDYALHDIHPADVVTGEIELPTCDQPIDVDDGAIRPIGEPRRWDVSPASLTERNEDVRYTERVTSSFSVGEGTTTLVCVRTSLISDPSVTTRLVSAVVSTRDLPLPVISIWGVHNTRNEPMLVTGYSGNGAPCGTWRAELYERRVLPTPEPICDFSDGIASGVENPPTGREVPLSGGFLDRYTFGFAPQSDRSARTVSTIDLRTLANCFDAPCALPGPSYHVARDSSGSVLVVEVTWTTGTGTNGAGSTTVTSFQDLPREPDAAAVPPYPLFGIQSSQLVPNSTNVGYDFTVRFRTYNPARYLVRLVPDPGSAPECLVGSGTETLERTGTHEIPDPTVLDEATVLTFRSLCVGTNYRVQVVLTDVFAIGGAAPASSTWGASPDVVGAPPGAFFGGDFLGSRVEVPPNYLDMRISVAVVGYDDLVVPGSGATPMLVNMDMNGSTVHSGYTFCPPTVGQLSETLYTPVRVLGGRTLHVSGTIQAAMICRRAGAAPGDPHLVPFTFAFDIPYNDVYYSPSEVRVTVFRDVDLGALGTVRVPAAVIGLAIPGVTPGV